MIDKVIDVVEILLAPFRTQQGRVDPIPYPEPIPYPNPIPYPISDSVPKSDSVPGQKGKYLGTESVRVRNRFDSFEYGIG